MAITIRFGRPKVSVKSSPDGDETAEKEQSIFTIKNFVLLGIGIAVGVILVQQAEINNLKNTVNYLQEVIR